MIFSPQGFNSLTSRMSLGVQTDKPFSSEINGQKVEPGAFFKSLVDAAEQMKPLKCSDNLQAENTLHENEEKTDLSSCLFLQLNTGGLEMLPVGVPESNAIPFEVPEGVEMDETTDAATYSPSEVLDLLSKIANAFAVGETSGTGETGFSDSAVGSEDLKNHLGRLLRVLASGRISALSPNSPGEEALVDKEGANVGGNFSETTTEFQHKLRKLSGRLLTLLNAAGFSAKPDLPSGENLEIRKPDIENVSIKATNATVGRPSLHKVEAQEIPGKIDRASGEKLQAAGSVLENRPIHSVDSGRSHGHHLTQVHQVIATRGGTSREEGVASEAPLSRAPGALFAGANPAGQTATAEMGLRQFVSVFAGEDPESSVEGLKTSGDKPVGEQVLQKIEKLLHQIEAGHMELKSPAGRESEPALSGSIMPSQTVSGGSEKNVEMVPEVRQAAMAAEKNLQPVEQRIVSQVFVRLSTGVQQGDGNMTIHMHPPELGRVRVRLVSEQGNLNIHLHPQNHQVVGILEKHLPILQQALEDQGVLLSDLQVSVDSGNQGEPQSGGQGRWPADQNPSSPPIEDEQSPLASTQYPERSAHRHELSLRI